jgi:uncharacterized membrane protein YfcA
MGGILSIFRALSIFIPGGSLAIEEISFIFDNFFRVLFANLAGTIICPAHLELCNIKNKLWYILMLVGVIGLLIVSLALLGIDSPILKIFFVFFLIILIIAFYLRATDDTITSNN